MLERRIVVDKDTHKLVLELSPPNEATIPVFSTRASLIAFAAAYGAGQGLYNQVNQPSKTPEPIRYSVFESLGYEPLINLLAVCHNEGAINSLENDEAASENRIEIFESYANGGLLELKQKLAHHPDKLEGLQMILNMYRDQDDPAPIDFKI